MGDTVDFQLGTDESADPKRGDPGKGDFRLSIGSVGGAPKAVVYRKVSDEKHPKTFFSGVWRDGVTFDSVTDPRYAASGTVVFSDGTSGAWIMDARGALGLKGLPEGYQPTPEDAESFRRELLSGLSARGIL